VQDYSQAIRLDPRFVGAIIGRGDAYLNRGQYDLAMQDYDRVVQLEPTNQQVLRNRRQARLEKAKQDSARALSIEANVPK
jgi:tetratricopeptide (TPR) repeat protein